VTNERVAAREHTALDLRADGSAIAEWAQEVLALANRWWIELKRDPLNLAFSLVQPAIWLLFFGVGVGRTIDKATIGTDDYIGFMIPGVISFTVMGSGVSAAMPMMWDKEGGYLDKLMSMPISRSSLIVSRFIYQVALMTSQVALVLVVGYAMGVRIEAGPAAVAVILLAAGLLTMAVTASFLALAYCVPGHGTFFAITGFVTLPLLFMSNSFVPLHAMPPWMEAVARLNPLTYAITAMRTVMIDGWERDAFVGLGVLTCVALAFLAVGTDQFRRQTANRV
jgi:ABC-2 type transport system permease protein